MWKSLPKGDAACAETGQLQVRFAPAAEKARQALSSTGQRLLEGMAIHLHAAARPRPPGGSNTLPVLKRVVEALGGKVAPHPPSWADFGAPCGGDKGSVS